MIPKIQHISEIDGRQRYFDFHAGALRIPENRKLLNVINVFPVADSDTGTHLALTLRYMTEATKPAVNIKKTAVALADTALTGQKPHNNLNP